MTDGGARRAWGTGLATVAADGTVLDTWYPSPALGPAPGPSEPAPSAEADDPRRTPLAALCGEDPRRRVRVELVTVEIDLDAPVAGTSDAYLRLHLLSHLLAEPNTISLDGLIPALPIVVWTTVGPMLPADFDELRPALRREGITATGLDKFPRLLDYVTPQRVRIADAARVRLGAHLAPGTTVMHEGFVNFNAGTLGASMVEGLISQGVVVGDGSDVGGGASIMGTLSGGGTHRVSIGRRSLLGANAGIGISLGDDCIVEAGLYVTAGTRVTLAGGQGAGRVVKAAELSGMSGVLFRRNSQSGAVEALPREGTGAELNALLHA